jgi:hypothetical protein
MAKQRSHLQKPVFEALQHGSPSLTAVHVDSYNLELRDHAGFIGDRANKFVFREKLEKWRKIFTRHGDDLLGTIPTEELSKQDIDEILNGKDSEAAAVVWSAIDDFARQLAHVLDSFLKEQIWKGTECVAVGGGIKDSEFGPLAIARASGLLAMDGFNIRVKPIVQDPDDAGLLGSIHLVPRRMLKGYQGMLAIDIGGSNIRVGIVRSCIKKKPDLSKAKVWKYQVWSHANDATDRDAAVKRIIKMLKVFIAKANESEFALAPIIGIGCPGIIEESGSIKRGAQNLPGGNWDADEFNLVEAVLNAVPSINGRESLIIMHNDAVVQGASQIPFMKMYHHWAVLTVGTGLGNARFTNLAQY